jgi:hypothetical protein
MNTGFYFIHSALSAAAFLAAWLRRIRHSFR